VANISRFLGLLGYSVNDQVKELIAASRDWLKGVGVELLAAFGPAALLSRRPSAPGAATTATARTAASEDREGDSRADRRGNPRKRLCDRRNVAIVA
jgi:hypothetical protein